MLGRFTDDLRPSFLPALAWGLALLIACDAAPTEKPANKDAPADKDAPAAAGEETKPGAAASVKPGSGEAQAEGDDADAAVDAKAEGDAAAADAGAADPPAASFADSINAISEDDADATNKAIAAYLERHGAAKHGERAVRADLTSLLDFVAMQAPKLEEELGKDAGLNAAACRFTKHCDSGKPTPKDEAKLQKFRDQGITVVYAGEGTVRAEVDYAPLGERLASVLTPGARAYLDAMTAQQRAMSNQDEGGYEGDPRELADAVVAWEKVATAGGETYADDAKLMGEQMLGAYLRAPWRPFEPSSRVTKELRKEYLRFVDEHSGSRYAPAVKHFLRAMKALKDKPSEAQLDAAITDAAKQVTHAK